MKRHSLQALLAVMFLSSCSGAVSRLSILEANILNQRGEHREAVVLYSRAARNPQTERYAAYGLGLVYLSVGELDPALGRFRFAAEGLLDSAESGAEGELAFRSRYNAGIAKYRSGDLEGAAEEFRKALLQDGSRFNAKRNLELCLRDIHRRRSPAASASQLGTRPSGADPKALFDYIREKESERWRNREWRADSANTPDY